MIASAIWRKEREFESRSDSGHTVLFDTSPGHPNGPTPMEAVLMALCACTSVDVVSILEKKREAFTGLTVTAQAEQLPQPPRTFSHIQLIYRVSGTPSKKAVEDAVSLSKNKYCSVSKMLEKSAKIEFTIEYADEQPKTEAEKQA
jgi:putative redox protein